MACAPTHARLLARCLSAARLLFRRGTCHIVTIRCMHACMVCAAARLACVRASRARARARAPFPRRHVVVGHVVVGHVVVGRVVAGRVVAGRVVVGRELVALQFLPHGKYMATLLQPYIPIVLHAHTPESYMPMVLHAHGLTCP